MSPLRDALTTLCGTLAVCGAIACLFAGAPGWAWGIFCLLPAAAWLVLGRAWLGALLGAITGLTL